MSQSDRTRLKKTYPYYRQRPIYVDLSNSTVVVANMGDSDATYIVLSTTASLSSERVLTAGSGLSLTDGGAGGAATLAIDNNVVATTSGSTFTQLSGSLQRTAAGLSYLVAGSNITITSSSNGQVVIAGSISGGSGADPGAQYLVMSTTASLANERAITAGPGILLTDGGAGGNATLAVATTLQALTQALSYNTTGNALTLLFSGSTIFTFDAYLQTHEVKATLLTTSSVATPIVQFTSGTAGKTYSIDAIITAQSTTTTGSGRWKQSGHYYRSGSLMTLVGSVVDGGTTKNVTALTASLTSSAGNILVNVTGHSSENYRWGVFFRVQEQGGA